MGWRRPLLCPEWIPDRRAALQPPIKTFLDPHQDFLLAQIFADAPELLCGSCALCDHPGSQSPDIFQREISTTVAVRDLHAQSLSSDAILPIIMVAMRRGALLPCITAVDLPMCEIEN